MYRGDFAGLIRVEVEFSSEEEAKNFQHYDWMGKEITCSAFLNDSQLVKMSSEQIKKIVALCNSENITNIPISNFQNNQKAT